MKANHNGKISAPNSECVVIKDRLKKFESKSQPLATALDVSEVVIKDRLKKFESKSQHYQPRFAAIESCYQRSFEKI